MNTLNIKTNESNRFICQFTDQLNLKNPNKNMALANFSIYYTWKNIKSEYSNNKFKLSAPTWNDKFNLPDESYSVLDMQKNIPDNPPLQICMNNLKNRIAFKINTGYKLELLSKETKQLLGS